MAQDKEEVIEQALDLVDEIRSKLRDMREGYEEDDVDDLLDKIDDLRDLVESLRP